MNAIITTNLNGKKQADINLYGVEALSVKLKKEIAHISII